MGILGKEINVEISQGKRLLQRRPFYIRPVSGRRCTTSEKIHVGTYVCVRVLVCATLLLHRHYFWK